MKGICFIEPLHAKVVSGSKTQTRRIISPQPEDVPFEGKGQCGIWYLNSYGDEPAQPRYRVGELVYLKEPYALVPRGENPSDVVYQYGSKPPYSRVKWQNKLFMPGRYARQFIQITGIRAERLQDISGEDCLKEGIAAAKPNPTLGVRFKNFADAFAYQTPQKAFAALIDKVNGCGTWKSNPIVYAYDFTLIK
jgi:hypothetical protein